MFLGEDRLPIVRRMILADTPDEETAALEELRVAQQADFIEILEAMDGLPVTVRLLDPPLHEFLPDTEELASRRPRVGLTDEEPRLFEAAMSWQEANPMLGTRGVRLGVIKPGLYAMQVRALMEAARERADGGRPPDRRDHDPPHGLPRGAGPRPLLGRARPLQDAAPSDGQGGRRGRRTDRGHHRHDDRDPTGRAAGGPRSPRWPTSSPSAPTTSPR